MRLALRLFWRDWRGGELGVLLGAVVLAVAIVTTLGLFVDRLQRAVEVRGATFMAGDLVLRARREIEPGWLDAARAAGLREATVLQFASMVFAGEQMQLVSVKAVSAAYPLLGRVGIADAVDAPLQELAHGPARGEIWVDARLLPALGIDVGASVGLGEIELRVSGILRHEPDGAGSFMALGPRLMMNLADVAASRLIQPGSRLQYAYLFAGEAEQVSAWRERMEPQLQSGQRFMTVEEGQPRIARTLARAESFLLLAGSLGVVMAGVALAMATRRYTERHADYVAIMKTLGLGSAAVRRIYAGNLLLLALFGVLCGWALGWLLQSAAFALIGGILVLDVPPAGLDALWLGAGTGVVCLLGLAAPPLLRMSVASPLRVLRRDLAQEPWSAALYASGFLAFALLLLWYSRDWRLALLVLGCLLASALVVGGFSYWLLRRARLPGVRAQGALRLAIAALARHAMLNALQILVFTLSIMLLLIMLLVRTALLDDWQRELPERTPNHFLVNIAPYQLDALNAFFSTHAIETAGLYPMVPGRIVAVNDAPPQLSEGEEFNVDREFNLTWAEHMPADNVLAAGQWWGDQAADEVSVEAGFAEALQLQLGDVLTVQVGAERFNARVSSIRSLDWDSMRPNFFLMFPQHLLQRQAGTWLTSFYLEPERKPLLNQLLREHPTISVLEMDAILAQLRGITAQLALAIELVLMLLLLAGALVMVASVQAGLDTRFHESAILRALGAGRRLVLGALVLEFALLGLLAGFLATIGAEAAAWFVQTRLMEMDFRLHPQLWLSGPLLGALIAGSLGLATCRRVVDTPPVVVLRELG